MNHTCIIRKPSGTAELKLTIGIFLLAVATSTAALTVLPFQHQVFAQQSSVEVEAESG